MREDKKFRCLENEILRRELGHSRQEVTEG
jgi:hypothetical protein